MRKVAQFALTTKLESKEQCTSNYQQVVAAVNMWLHQKGTTIPGADDFRLVDGRSGTLRVQETTNKVGAAASWKLSEPISGGRFTSDLSIACSDGELAFNCVLLAGNPDNILAPVPVEARCPQIVRTIIDLDLGWKAGLTTVSTKPLMFCGLTGGQQLIELLRQDARSLPVIVVSEHYGLVLHPNISNLLARDISGLAIVAQVDGEASWGMTRTVLKEWSCYSGAIRIYWPNLKFNGNPLDHPLWTSQRLLQDVDSTEEAAKRIRTLLRRRLFGISAFAVEPPQLFETIQRASIEEDLAVKRKLAEDHADFKQLADSYAADNVILKRDLENARETIRQLREDIYNYQARLVWREEDTELLPSLDTPPGCVEEAVERAKIGFSHFLTFGDDVSSGIHSLAVDAGPPDKIFGYLQALVELVQARRDGELGCAMVPWLIRRGISASGESETIRNNKNEMNKREWHDGRQQKQFDLHLKPSEATSPDKCVRIYFDWDDASAKILVGWVGRHL